MNDKVLQRRIDKLIPENNPERFDGANHIPHESEKVTRLEDRCVARSEPFYNPLKMFYEIAKKYFAASTPQDLEKAIKEQRETYAIVHKDYFGHLREENERLEDELNELKAAEESLADEQANILYERDEFHKEIKKLKRLTLHLFERVADTEAAEWAKLTSTWCENKVSKLCKRHEEQWSRIAKKCGDEYHKMKTELMMKEK